MAGSTVSAISHSASPPEVVDKLGSLGSVTRSNDAAERDPWIFREGRRMLSGIALVRGISAQVQRGSVGWVDALIQAGELEAALADIAYPAATLSAELTDAIANAVCTGNNSHAAHASDILGRLQTPEFVSISPPEGFTYYALHPLDFANVTSHVSGDSRPVVVIGIRSIGTTLSAMTTASLRHAGRPASRITVRPTGHPYSRTSEFSHEQRAWLRQQAAVGAQFVIVDEGPGRSGSTFLSVAEALLDVGIAHERITLIGSRNPDPESLCAANAVGRWSQFRFIATSPSVNSRFKDFIYAGGGNWREVFFADQLDWPESWTQTERLKFISPDKRALYKFEGMGRIGAEARERASTLSQGNFIPRFSDGGDGFLAYDLIDGQRLRARDINSKLLDHMARYCAFRSSNFALEHCGPSELKHMVEFNIQQEFGIDFSFRQDELSCYRPVLVDGRMQPHEWIGTSPETFVKTDAIDHGDNHFFPGSCDIAWDLAGIAVEWQLQPSDLEYLLHAFQDYSGDGVRLRLPGYLLAYAVFRTGFCKMALQTDQGSVENPRLRSAYNRYRREALHHLQSRVKSS